MIFPPHRAGRAWLAAQRACISPSTGKVETLFGRRKRLFQTIEGVMKLGTALPGAQVTGRGYRRGSNCVLALAFAQIARA
ncbi:hypothetical protein [Aminobacter sp. MSH1]|uniref:hypothetical protein n=1 Tax=Aminobacter sp. MSH1 TaxID=374606 RepID=UPI00131F0DAA|nr:hypothetical protein [Aminobacter sp. MSH1]